MTSKIVRVYIWRKFSGEFTPNHLTGYMTAIKPYSEWGTRAEAHLFTLKQAIKICRSMNNQPYPMHEVWGYSRVNSIW